MLDGSHLSDNGIYYSMINIGDDNHTLLNYTMFYFILFQIYVGMCEFTTRADAQTILTADKFWVNPYIAIVRPVFIQRVFVQSFSSNPIR